MQSIKPVSLGDIRAARGRITGIAIRTPLIRLHIENAPADIYLKLENLQPIGSFKIRGAANAIALADAADLAHGVYTASAGNMAQGVAFVARLRGLACDVIVPNNAPDAKIQAILRLGGRVIKESFDRWWQIMLDHGCPDREGLFVHPVSDPAVIAGNGTIGLEIMEDLPDVESIVVPYGGGGLSGGIASAVKAIRPAVRVFACEVDTAAPLSASLKAGRPVPIEYRPSFVDGIGGKGLMPEMWDLAREWLDGSLVCSVREVADALRLLVERSRVVAEGAGACPVAAAMGGRAGGGKVVCVVSGGNIDLSKLATILGGQVP